LSSLLYAEEDVEVVYLKRVVFTAASSNEEPLSPNYYDDDDDSELHYKFTAFGRCKSHINELFP
jgi:hypothetical protein